MITFGYTTLARAKEWLGIPTGSADQDALVESLITGASRAIDEHCRRRFYAATETRYLDARHGHCVRLDQDLRSSTTLKTDEDGDRTYEVTWSAATDYVLLPRNGPLDGLPYDAIERDPVSGRYSFPTWRRHGVELDGSWGFCATGAHPMLIEEACLLAAARQYARKNAPLGVAGSVETGFIRVTLDRDVSDKLWPFVREAVTG